MPGEYILLNIRDERHPYDHAAKKTGSESRSEGNHVDCVVTGDVEGED